MTNPDFRAFYQGKMVDVFGLSPKVKKAYLSRLQVFGVEGDDILVSYDTDFFNKMQEQGVECEEPCVLMQFTGLRDSTRTKEHPNGRKIYEGDIVRFHYVGFHEFRIGKVEYSRGRAGFIFGGIDYRAIDRIEVIGNIYENPELLK
jgi:hypothetical protein